MLNWGSKPKQKKHTRSLDELRKQLVVVDGKRLSTLKGGQGIKRTPPALKACGGWLPQ